MIPVHANCRSHVRGWLCFAVLGAFLFLLVDRFRTIVPAEDEVASTEVKFLTPQRMVMTWVPPYGTDKSLQRLNESFDGLGMGDGLSHLCLQFWEPVAGGGLRRVERGGDTGDSSIQTFRDWGHAHGIRVLLCFYNYSVAKGDWDWPAAQDGFRDHPEELARNLVDEVRRLGLDGVDLDLEGLGELDADRAKYIEFVRRLSEMLRKDGKQLTIDTFAYIWHGPNQSWWKELFPLVNGINSMGYQEIASGPQEEPWRTYFAQEAVAGEEVGKLMLGMPGHSDHWRGGSTIEHLRWILNEGRAGVSIWDVQLSGAAWRTREAWEILRSIRDTQGTARPASAP